MQEQENSLSAQIDIAKTDEGGGRTPWLISTHEEIGRSHDKRKAEKRCQACYIRKGVSLKHQLCRVCYKRYQGLGVFRKKVDGKRVQRNDGKKKRSK